jgi:hypothetical protein
VPSGCSLVAERLKQEGKQDARTVDTMEEIEDSEGNVYDKRTYGSSFHFSSLLTLSAHSEEPD